MTHLLQQKCLMPQLVQFKVAVDAEGAEAVYEFFNAIHAAMGNEGSDGAGRAVIEAAHFPDESDLQPELVDLAHAETIFVSTVVPAGPGAEEMQHRIARGLWWLSRLHPVGEPVITTLEDKDWQEAWKEHYATFRVGRRIVIQPVWEEPEKGGPGDILLRLNPGMAFGTGLHPSTQLCLVLLEDYLQAGDQLLDLGTGSGILAIASLKLGAAEVVATDTDTLALQVAEENAAYNALQEQLGKKLKLHCTPDPPAGKFDVIVVNILPDVICHLLREKALLARAKPGAILVLSGIIAERAQEVEAILDTQRCSLVEKRTQGDWVAIVGKVPCMLPQGQEMREKVVPSDAA